MQASISRVSAVAPLTGKSVRSTAARRAPLVVKAAATSPSNGEIGEKIAQWFATPFDVAAFGPRITVGALLSAPDRLNTLQQDVEKLSELVQDPRPLEDKSAEVLLQVEDIVTECLAKGATVESDVINETYNMLETVLPAEVMTPLKDIKDQIPEPPSSSASATVTETIVTEADETVTMPPATPATQEAGELLALKDSVNSVMGCIDAIRANEDPAAANVLSLNLKEARDGLSRSLNELSPTVRMSDDISVTSSIAEAESLLEDIDTQFDF